MAAATSGLVSTAWVAEHLDDPHLTIIEVSQTPDAYASGHLPGARAVDWQSDLRDPAGRNVPSVEQVQALWQRLGITPDTTVVLYGDSSNWYACCAYWLLRFYGLERVALMDGGRDTWTREHRPLTTTAAAPPACGACRAPRAQGGMRAGFWDVLGAIRERRHVVLDVRTPAEYRGDALTEPSFPEEAVKRAGHIPTAVNLPWSAATDTSGCLRPRPELEAIYAEAIGPDRDRPVIVCCRIGERSAHTWFVLHKLLGYRDVRNYDGSFREWAAMPAMPIAHGPDPGTAPATSVPYPSG